MPPKDISEIKLVRLVNVQKEKEEIKEFETEQEERLRSFKFNRIRRLLALTLLFGLVSFGIFSFAFRTRLTTDPNAASEAVTTPTPSPTTILPSF